MTVSLRKFNTDFTSFLDGKVRHTVKIVTDTEVLECSGMILSQHSEILKQLVLEDDEIFLDNYIHAKDCLTILYGGSVALTMENIQEIMKFSVQFDIPEIMEQALTWIEGTVDVSNFLEFVKMCSNTVKCGKRYDRNMEDFYWPPIRYILTRAPVDTDVDAIISDIISAVAGQDTVFDISLKSGFTGHFISHITRLISKDYVKVVLKILDSAEVFENLAECPPEKVAEFFDVIENLSASLQETKLLIKIKECTAKVMSTNSLVTKMDCFQNKTEFLTTWKDMDRNEIILLTKLMEMKEEDHFYLLEMIMSWVTANKPKLKTVQTLWDAIKITSLTPHYLDHSVSVFKALGYDVFYNKQLAGTSAKTSEHGINQDNGLNYMSMILEGTQDADADGKTLYKVSYSVIVFRCCEKSRIQIDRRRTTLYGITVSCENGDGTKIEYEATPLVYARTYSGEHIPFYTDIKKAACMIYDPDTINIMWGSCKNVYN